MRLGSLVPGIALAERRPSSRLSAYLRFVESWFRSIEGLESSACRIYLIISGLRTLHTMGAIYIRPVRETTSGVMRPVVSSF